MSPSKGGAAVPLSEAQLDDLSIVATRDSTLTGGWVAIRREQLCALLNDSRALASVRKNCDHSFDAERCCLYCDLQAPEEDGPDGYEPGKSVWSGDL